MTRLLKVYLKSGALVLSLFAAYAALHLTFFSPVPWGVVKLAVDLAAAGFCACALYAFLRLKGPRNS
jgi:hypothetical protein